MKLFKTIAIAALSFMAVILGSCIREELPDNRETEYGYVQFKLYKEDSYTPDSKVIKDELDYLAEASKIRLTMQYGAQTISQTLVLSAGSAENAEYGLRSDNLKLLSGDYTIVNYLLLDALDEPLYESVAGEGQTSFTIVPGGLLEHDLTVDVTPRGKVRFTLVKDSSRMPETKGSVNREYIFEEVRYFSVELEDVNDQANKVSFEKLPATFSIHFDGSDDVENGWQTSSVACDSILSMPAGTYKIISYKTFDANSEVPLEVADNLKLEDRVVVSDNKLTDVDVPVSLHEMDAYLKDHYALKAIWDALDGEHWSYNGQSYNPGCNWDFNKDVDLWSYQPGVQVHPNGRIALIDLSGFGIKGDMPKELGQLTELIELYLGTHSDDQTAPIGRMSTSSHFYEGKNAAERETERMEYKKLYASSHTNQHQMSPACALALKMHGLTSSAASSYEGMTEEEIFLAGTKGFKSGNDISLMDVRPGEMHSGLRSLPKEIGRLTSLEKLNIANCNITDFERSDENSDPEDGSYTPGFLGLQNLTDLEIYNCPDIERLPDLSSFPNLKMLNLSHVVNNNDDTPSSITEKDVRDALVAMAKGATGKSLQILYCNGNSLTAFPAEMKDFADLAMMDFYLNEITSIPAMGKDFDPSELTLSYNKIERFEDPDNFCDIDMLTSLSLNNNLLTEVPDIFASNSKVRMSTVDLSYNRITKFADSFFEGTGDKLWVQTFNLGGNPFGQLPTGLFDRCLINYLIMSNCGLKEIPEGFFTGQYSKDIISLDFQFNRIKKFPEDFNAVSFPYFYGLDISYNSFTEVPAGALDCRGMTVFGFRNQTDENGDRCMRTWPSTITDHIGLRAFYLGDNDIRKVVGTEVSPTVYFLEICGNDNITFDASAICSAWQSGMYYLYYDKSQNIINCDPMLQ